MEEEKGKERAECKCKYLQLNLSTTTAAEYGDLDALSHRLSPCNNNKYRIQIIPGNTPLHLSSQHGHTAMTSYLLKMGYDPNTGMLSVPSSVPLRSLHYNNDKSNPQDRTDDTTQVQEQKSNHNSATCTTPTPLHRACHSGALGCIQLLLNAHADILIPD